MSLGHWLWLVGGCPFALACAVAWERSEAETEGGEWVSGFVFLAVWFFAPFVAGGLALIAFVATMSAAVRRLERRIPRRPSRGDLERRIAELERDTEMTP